MRWTCARCGARHVTQVTSPADRFRIGAVEYCCVATFARAAAAS